MTITIRIPASVMFIIAVLILISTAHKRRSVVPRTYFGPPPPDPYQALLPANVTVISKHQQKIEAGYAWLQRKLEEKYEQDEILDRAQLVLGAFYVRRSTT